MMRVAPDYSGKLLGVEMAEEKQRYGGRTNEPERTQQPGGERQPSPRHAVAGPVLVAPPPIADITELPLPSGGLEEMNVLAFGAGDAWDAFLKGPAKAYAAKYSMKYIFIDIMSEKDGLARVRGFDIGNDRVEYVEMPKLAAAGPTDEYKRRLTAKLEGKKISGVIVALPPILHCTAMELAAGMNVPIFVQKPFVLTPDQCQRVRKLPDDVQKRIVALDGDFDKSVVLKALKYLHENPGKFGALASIESETLILGTEERKPYLRDGLYLDLAPHALAQVAMGLHMFGMSLADFRTDKERSFLARYEGAFDGRETYAHHALIDEKTGVKIDLKAGKGVKAGDRGIPIIRVVFRDRSGASLTIDHITGVFELRDGNGHVAHSENCPEPLPGHPYANDGRKTLHVARYGDMSPREQEFRLQAGLDIIEAIHGVMAAKDVPLIMAEGGGVLQFRPEKYRTYKAGEDPETA